ncbi:RNA polymerase subunit sigma-70 [Streptomyces albipurpureus]|uniref:RNA polymerase subunit sigma-70 n=1 Tax=Streptomyces albipurpureus TaxID=2897419 RepID=A0ABT0UFD3_9ACTN|nr:RNA polymerase subunit sigma-70 [Streptomyces sp. CWNU-1]MCM2386941.1 RNA polymerase subunit sigma-70 [Streptomyces sp. CWNU-1]
MTDLDATTAIRNVFAQLGSIPDPVDRARAVGVVLDDIPTLQAELRALRQDAVLAMRETRSLAETAAALGISLPRVSQIVKGISRTSKKK